MDPPNKQDRQKNRARKKGEEKQSLKNAFLPTPKRKKKERGEIA